MQQVSFDFAKWQAYIQERIRKKDDIVDGMKVECWIWTKCKNEAGYGYCGFGERSNVLAHRVAWTVFKGEIPAGAQVRHICPNNSCCNPQHLKLFVGKAAEVLAGKRKKTRLQRGPKYLKVGLL